jgi:hypothetical protein
MARKCFCFSDSPASHLIEIVTNGKEHRVRKSFSCFPCIIVVSSPTPSLVLAFYCAICNNRCSPGRRARRQNEIFIISLAGLGSETLDIQVHRLGAKIFLQFFGEFMTRKTLRRLLMWREMFVLLYA